MSPVSCPLPRAKLPQTYAVSHLGLNGSTLRLPRRPLPTRWCPWPECPADSVAVVAGRSHHLVDREPVDLRNPPDLRPALHVACCLPRRQSWLGQIRAGRARPRLGGRCNFDRRARVISRAMGTRNAKRRVPRWWRAGPFCRIYRPTDSAQPPTEQQQRHRTHHQQQRLARLDVGTRRDTRAPARVLRFRRERFHNASTALFTTGLIAAAPDGQSASKAVRGDGRCLARTGDLLLVRQALYQLS
jgi:hypothetical protein